MESDIDIAFKNFVEALKATDQGLAPEEKLALDELVQEAEKVVIEPELVKEEEPIKSEAESPKAVSVKSNQQEGDESKDIRAMISEMSIPQKIKLALLGSSVCRTLLILDPNRMIQGFVLKNPRLTQKEVEDFAKNPNLAENVIRTIADSRQWMKTQNIKYNVVTNPKTPGDIALKWLRYLSVPDLRKISKSKNIPQLVSVTAKKRLADVDEKS